MRISTTIRAIVRADRPESQTTTTPASTNAGAVIPGSVTPAATASPSEATSTTPVENQVPNAMLRNTRNHEITSAIRSPPVTMTGTSAAIPVSPRSHSGTITPSSSPTFASTAIANNATTSRGGNELPPRTTTTTAATSGAAPKITIAANGSPSATRMVLSVSGSRRLSSLMRCLPG